jgi:pimeloyl-ACP methyl ester carboxylesterase
MEIETRYALSGDVSIAYQVFGSGPLDLVVTPGAWSHLEVQWERPEYARFMQRLASFARVITYDKRGTGLSDRVSTATLEERMDDVRAVMDAAGSQRAALFGISEGGPLSILFAATYPDRTQALILYGTFARFTRSFDYPFRQSREEVLSGLDQRRLTWGQVESAHRSLNLVAPSVAGDHDILEWWLRFGRLAVSPGAAVALSRMNLDLDVRHVLPVIRVQALVLGRTDDGLVAIECVRDLAERIPGARLVELPGIDHITYFGDSDAVVDEVEEFLTGVRHVPEPDRVLATILFTDIVGSTEQAVALGDHRWSDLKQAHHAVVRRELGRFRGQEIDTAGDGFFATFDGPARAVRCAQAVRDGVRPLGLQIRAGLHTGEVELQGSGVTGIAVHIGARVAAQAGPSEVLVSSTVKDLVAGSGLSFEERGSHALKGVPGEWRLFAAV